MVEAYATNPATAAMSLSPFPHQQPPMETSERVEKTDLSNVNPAESNTKTANNEEIGEAKNIVGAVH